MIKIIKEEVVKGLQEPDLVNDHKETTFWKPSMAVECKQSHWFWEDVYDMYILKKNKIQG